MLQAARQQKCPGICQSPNNSRSRKQQSLRVSMVAGLSDTWLSTCCSPADCGPAQYTTAVLCRPLQQARPVQ